MTAELTRRAVASAGLVLAGCATAGPGLDHHAFAASDGVPVGVTSYGSGRHGVILVPGGHGVGETWHPQAQRLARAGLWVLTLDYRGLGRSLAAKQDDRKLDLDIVAAARWLRAKGADRVSGVGASHGGWALGRAAAAEPGLLDRLVFLGASGVEAPERIGGRKLFIVARNDRDGSGRARLDGIRRQFDAAPEPKALVVLEGAAHAQLIFLSPEGERLFAELQRFLIAA